MVQSGTRLQLELLMALMVPEWNVQSVAMHLLRLSSRPYPHLLPVPLTYPDVFIIRRLSRLYDVGVFGVRSTLGGYGVLPHERQSMLPHELPTPSARFCSGIRASLNLMLCECMELVPARHRM